MRKILLIVGLLLGILVGCSQKDVYGLGEYKERHYVNKDFNLDFEITKDFSFLTTEELAVKNNNAHDLSGDEMAKYFNNILNVSSLSGAKLVAYVESTPNLSTTEEKIANEYLDFLSESDVKYSMNRDKVMMNGLEFYHLSLELDFNGRQDIYIAINNGKVLNLQITYTNDTEDVAKQLIEMIQSNVK